MLTYMITGDGESELLVERSRAAIELGVDWIQIRRKGASARWLSALVERVLEALPRARARDVFVNDRLDVALALGAGGVHLPEDGVPVARARALAPREFRIGASVHGLERAVAAEAAGADFVVLGPVFATSSKPGHPGLGPAVLREVAERLRVPVLAVGGVSAERLESVRRAGAEGVAAISAFENDRRAGRLVELARSGAREVGP